MECEKLQKSNQIHKQMFTLLQLFVHTFFRLNTNRTDTFLSQKINSIIEQVQQIKTEAIDNDNGISPIRTVLR